MRHRHPAFWIGIAVVATHAAGPMPASGQAVPVAVKSLTGPADQSGSTSQPGEFVEVGNTVFFVAQDDVNGRELWKTDGTGPGTNLVRDLWPGPGTSSGPRNLMELGGVLLFVASDGEHGLELWRSDGTASGTVMLADIEPGAIGSDPRQFVRAGAEVFFQATLSQSTPGYWRTDGTTAGTYRVVVSGACCLSDASCTVLTPDACRTAGGWARGPLSTCNVVSCPGPVPFVCCLPDARCEFRYEAACLADDGLLMPPGSACLPSPCGEPSPAACCLASQVCIIASGADCSAAGGSARRAHDACEPNPCVCLEAPCCLPGGTCQLLAPQACTSAGGTTRGNSGSCLPTTCALPEAACDGRFVRCCLPDGSCVLAQDSVACLAFRGVPNGVNITCEGAPTPCSRPVIACCRPNGSCQIEYLEPCLATGGIPYNFGNGPCATVSCPAQDPLAGQLGLPIGQAGGLVYLYDGRDGSPGHGLWAWNPAGGTVWLRDFRSSPTFAHELGGRLLFLADEVSTGLEWWTSDGTPSGTVVVADILPGSASGVLATYPDSLDAPRHGATHSYFFASDGTHGRQMWRTDGTAAGTARLTSLANISNSSAGPIVVFGASAVFAASGPTPDVRLYGLDAGTAEGCVVLTDAPIGRASSAAATNRAYFGYRSLWETDGTPAGTRQVLTIPHTSGIDISPTNLAWLAGRSQLFMNANEPWVSDGTAAGSTLLRDIASGIWSRTLRPVGGDRLIFSAFQTGAGFEPFVSNGTEAGTVLLRDVNPGAANSNVQNLVHTPRPDGSNITFFTADSPGFTQALWVTDGTPAGTRMVGNPDYASQRAGVSASSSIRSGSVYYCKGNFGNSGPELFKTDGTVAGTGLVADLLPGPAGGLDQVTFAGATTADGVFCFVGIGGLYRTNGTAAGTSLLKAHQPPSNIASVKNPIAFQGLVYFTVSGLLWRTDGTPAGTVAVDPSATLPFNADRFTIVGDRLFYSATDGGGAGGHGFELWSTTGQPGGTARLTDLYPGTTSSNPTAIQAFDNQAVFLADTPSGRRIFRSDGTSAGTTQLLNTTAFPHSPNSILVWNNVLLIHAASRLWAVAGIGGTPTELTSGIVAMLEPTPVGGVMAFVRQHQLPDLSQIWVTDGTPAGTRQAVLGIEFGTGVYLPSDLRAVGDDLYFVGRGDRGPEWYRTNLQSSTASLALDMTPGSGTGDLSPLGVLGADLLFTATDPIAGSSLYRFGQSTGLSRVGIGGRIITPLRMESPIASGGQLYFTGNDSSCCPEKMLFASDGTDQGTRLIADFSPTPSSSAYGVLPGADLLGQLVFSARRSQTGEELYVLDPLLGPKLLSDMVPGAGDSLPHGFGLVGDKLFYAAKIALGASGSELCVTDGTAQGTTLVAQIGTFSSSANPRFITALDGIAVFVADDATHGSEIWRSDGTPEGTWLVHDIVPGPGSPDIVGLTRMGGHVYFAATTSEYGRELWRSDGTSAGTAQVRDAWLGPAGSNPSWLTATGSRLHFVAYTPETGIELWITDGTAAGTFMLFELSPGPSGSGIEQLVVSGNQLYFLATVLPQGTSLWTYQWPTLLAFCRGDYNRSGGMPTVQDLFDFLFDWFSGASRADFNGSGQITVQDLFDFLTAYFTGCS